MTDKKVLYFKDLPTLYDPKNKVQNIKDYVSYMLVKSSTMFKYHNLPDTLPPEQLELLLQTNGYVIVTKHDGDLYAFMGGLGGEPDVYLRPTIATVSSPALKFNETLKIGSECVVISNDILQNGLLPIYNQYCTLLVENTLTMYISNINKRIPTLISASDDNTVESAKTYIKKMFDGEIGVIAENQLFDSLKTHTNGGETSNKLTELIEYHQYLKAGLLNEIGLNANFNMKRERLLSGEVELNSDSLYPLVDNMYQCRQLAISQINNMYGTNIQVEFNSSWDYRVLQGEPIDTKNDIVDPNSDFGELDNLTHELDIKDVEIDPEQFKDNVSQVDPEPEQVETTEQVEPEPEQVEPEPEQVEPEPEQVETTEQVDEEEKEV